MLFFSSVNVYALSSLLFKIVKVVVENNLGFVPIHFNNQEEGTKGPYYSHFTLQKFDIEFLSIIKLKQGYHKGIEID